MASARPARGPRRRRPCVQASALRLSPTSFRAFAQGFSPISYIHECQASACACLSQAARRAASQPAAGRRSPFRVQYVKQSRHRRMRFRSASTGSPEGNTLAVAQHVRTATPWQLCCASLFTYFPPSPPYHRDSGMCQMRCLALSHCSFSPPNHSQLHEGTFGPFWNNRDAGLALCVQSVLCTTLYMPNHEPYG